MEGSKIWEGKFTVDWVRHKQAWMEDDGVKRKQCNTAQLFPAPRPSDDRVLQREQRNLRPVVEPDVLCPDVSVLLTETLHTGDPTIQSPEFLSAKRDELVGRNHP